MNDGTYDIFRVDCPVEALLARNEESRKNTRYGLNDNFRLVADVPANLAHDCGLMEAFDNKDHTWVRRWMNDSDNRAFRTSEGSV
ncbi:hypothetical protein [Liberibacter crescens]|nr:hypothetical protein [Liberibacter crescens]